MFKLGMGPTTHGARGEVRIWNASDASPIHSFSIDTRIHSMCSAEIQGVQTVWIGCDDQVRVFDASKFSLRSILPLPHTGEVTCMANVAIDVVWVGVRNRDNKGSLYVWDFAV
jgi:WD40 repeat protein